MLLFEHGANSLSFFITCSIPTKLFTSGIYLFWESALDGNLLTVATVPTIGFALVEYDFTWDFIRPKFQFLMTS